MVKNYTSFSDATATYCIAEIGINHNGSLSQAIELVKAAKRAGADAAKFQTYVTEKRAPKNNQEIFDILKKNELSHKDFLTLKECADDVGIEFFSTAFDEESIDILEDIGVETYKLASFDVSNTALLKAVSKTQKSIIFSTGMATLDEIQNAYNILDIPNDKLGILHCVSSYPLAVESCQLSNIYSLSERYDCRVGYSDHTKTIDIPLYAVCAGAKIIEKHFYLHDQHECIDEPVSITEEDFLQMITKIRLLEKIISKPEFGIKDAEKAAVQFKRTS
ncbi:N-acetylneuraminate synthase family protein [Acinetobacter sp.]|uniref:N-acetylneuraminate synthase family protein n=1 Tax=Acinetobacter sp. TaxID=472 RepID=UPI000C4B4AD4|nr:N-acetylneuraminate synthase family protein [Acinetobacter sp.]MBC69475.1 N-acetylneuraminate synthase [Acinetobacter sp.]